MHQIQNVVGARSISNPSPERSHHSRHDCLFVMHSADMLSS